jgi:hypothetical protein
VLDVGLFLTVIGVLFAVPILWIVGLVVVVFGALRWLLGAARYVSHRFAASRSLTTVPQ